MLGPSWHHPPAQPIPTNFTSLALELTILIFKIQQEVHFLKPVAVIQMTG